MKLRNLLIFALIPLVLTAFSGCSLKSADKTKTLNMCVGENPRTLNPIIASEGTSITLCSYMFDPLLKFNEKMEVVGNLADTWEISKDKKTWTFNLKKNITWHDGAPFTAKDVKFTFDTLYDTKTNTLNRGKFLVDNKPVEIKIINDHKIQFVLPKPFAPFETNLTMLGIAPEHILKGADINKCEFNTNPIGTGAYKIKTWQQGDKIILEANKNYFRGAPLIEQIVYKIIPSRESRRIALQRQEIDIMAPLDEQDLKTLPQFPFLTKFESPQYCYYYFAFDLTKPMFQDINIRRAINHAIDKQKMLNNVMPGLGEIVNGPMPKESWAHSDDAVIYKYDPKEAMRLIESSGYKKGKDGIYEKGGKKLEFEIAYGQTNARFHKIAVLIQSFLKEVGIKANIRSYETNVLYDITVPGKFYSIIWDWLYETPDPDCFTEWHSSQADNKGMNYLSYKNPKADKILEEARTTYDKETRKKLYAQFQKIVSSDAAYVFLWSPKSITAVNTRVKGDLSKDCLGNFIRPEKLYLEK